MNFFEGLRDTYKEGWAFMLLCPMVAAIPVAAELMQHAGEMHIGMYNNVDMARQVEDHPLRTGLGLVKIGAILLTVFWMSRFLGFRRNVATVMQFDWLALRLFSAFFLIQLLLAVLQVLLLPKTAGWAIGALVFGSVFNALTAAWGAGSALGNIAMSFGASVRLMAGYLPRTIAFMLLAGLPLLVLHYVAGGLAIAAASIWTKWAILFLDSLLVGLLSAILAAAGYFAADHAAGKQGVSLAG